MVIKNINSLPLIKRRALILFFLKGMINNLKATLNNYNKLFSAFNF